MADNPQQTVRELRGTRFPRMPSVRRPILIGLKKYAVFGLAGAVLMGVGVFFLAIGALRAMQQYGGWLVHGNWSWTPYFVVVIVLVAIAASV